MKTKIKVSIITVVYNGAATIEQTINSVIRQNYDNIEYIIVDGASADGTVEIVGKYRKYIDIFISEPDCGIYDAMNKGIQCATGEIVGFINSDDWYAERVIGYIAECFESTQAEIVHGEVQIVEENGEFGKRTRWSHNYEDIHERMLPHPAIFAKMSVFKKQGAFNLKYKIAADFDWLLRCYVAGVRLQYFDGVVAYYRRGGISSSQNKVNKLMLMTENRNISLKYLDGKQDSAYKKEQMKARINKKYQTGRFRVEIEDTPILLYKMLEKHFHEMKDGLIIFGTGRWGDYCCTLLQKCGVQIRFFVDNDKNKWGKMLYDIEIVSPDMLKMGKGHILIAILSKGQEIAKQLSMYQNVQLDWVSIDELSDAFIEK